MGNLRHISTTEQINLTECTVPSFTAAFPPAVEVVGKSGGSSKVAAPKKSCRPAQIGNHRFSSAAASSPQMCSISPPPPGSQSLLKATRPHGHEI